MIDVITLNSKNFNKLKLKRTSIRRGVKDYKLGKSKINCVDTGDSVGCNIVSVERVLFGDLTLTNAIDDGFFSLKDLTDELLDIYGHIRKSEPMTVVRFELSANQHRE